MRTGWEGVNAAVAAAREAVAAVAPDDATAAEAYVMRVLSSCLNDAFLGHLFAESGLTRALPTRGGPNPDYRMAHAQVDAAGRYRLEGRLNESERVGIGLYSFGAGGSADLAGYAAFDRASVDGEGRFSLHLSADADGPGTLAIPPEARVLMIRTLHRDPAGEPARVLLDGGTPVGDLTLARGTTEGALGQVAGALTNAIRTFLEWTAVTSAAANRFHAETPAMAQGVQGDPDTIYFLGAYQLGEGEWLEVTMPAGIPGYWSLHAYNHWCESLPGAGVGDRGSVADADGRIRIAVGPSGAGDAPNRIDTIGRRRGALICRIIGATSVAVPETKLYHGRKPA
jgi:hypothetical protein